MKLFHIITALLCLLLSVEAALPLAERLPAELPNNGFGNKFKWNPVEINKQQYIPLSDLQIFYRFDRLDINDKTIKLINPALTINLTTGTQTATINKVKFILSEPIRQHNGTAHISSLDLRTLIDPILRPIHQKTPPFKTVILDAGHGGKDEGSAKLESKHTLALTRQVRAALKKKGYAVVLTRDKDIFVPLARRVQIANTTPDAIFISLHFNSGNKRAHGFESFLMSARQPRPTHAASLALTTAIHSQCLIYLNKQPLDKLFKTSDRGIKRARFNVLSNCKHPSVIIEAGFLTHKQEAEKIAHIAYQKHLTQAIVGGIELYNQSLRK